MGGYFNPPTIAHQKMLIYVPIIGHLQIVYKKEHYIAKNAIK